MAIELFRNDYLSVSLEGDLLTLIWSKEEPGDDHAAATAQQATSALNQYLTAHPEARLRVLVDLMVVKGSFPRATATYTSWLLVHRGAVRLGAFATRNLLMRAGLKAATLVPGVTLKGFGDLEEARRFVQAG